MRKIPTRWFAWLRSPRSIGTRSTSDVVVDLIGYRRHGHSEVDDPTVTQPRRYAIIKDHPPLYKLYAEAALAWIAEPEVQEIQKELLEDQKDASKAEHKPVLARAARLLEPLQGRPLEPDDDVTTGFRRSAIAEVGAG